MTDYAPDIPDFGGQLSALTYDHGSATARTTRPARSPPDELVADAARLAHRGQAPRRHDGTHPRTRTVAGHGQLAAAVGDDRG